MDPVIILNALPRLQGTTLSAVTRTPGFCSVSLYVPGAAENMPALAFGSVVRLRPTWKPALPVPSPQLHASDVGNIPGDLIAPFLEIEARVVHVSLATSVVELRLPSSWVAKVCLRCAMVHAVGQLTLPRPLPAICPPLTSRCGHVALCEFHAAECSMLGFPCPLCVLLHRSDLHAPLTPPAPQASVSTAAGVPPVVQRPYCKASVSAVLGAVRWSVRFEFRFSPVQSILHALDAHFRSLSEHRASSGLRNAALARLFPCVGDLPLQAFAPGTLARRILERHVRTVAKKAPSVAASGDLLPSVLPSVLPVTLPETLPALEALERLQVDAAALSLPLAALPAVSSAGGTSCVSAEPLSAAVLDVDSSSDVEGDEDEGGDDGGRRAPSIAWVNPRLNKQQQGAVESILAGRHGLVPYLLVGPAGTGKTSTLVEAIIQVLWTKSGGERGGKPSKPSRVLIVAPSDEAADLILLALHDALSAPAPASASASPAAAPGASAEFPVPSETSLAATAGLCPVTLLQSPSHVRATRARPQHGMLRFNLPSRKSDSLQHAALLQYCVSDTYQGLFVLPPAPVIAGCRVVVATALACSSLRSILSGFAGLDTEFSHLFFDEASQCMELESLVPLTLAGAETAVVITGARAQPAEKETMQVHGPGCLCNVQATLSNWAQSCAPPWLRPAVSPSHCRHVNVVSGCAP